MSAPITDRPASRTTRADANPTVEGAPDPRRWWALATIALGVSLVIMDATIVNVALPVVIGALSLDATTAEWMNAIYALVFAGLLLSTGRLGDVRGRRRTFALGMGIFIAASVAAGAATSGAMLVSARAVQGVGAAMILPTTLSTMNALFHGRERGIAFAVYGSTIGGMAAFGPLVGGWLATDVSWRWAFWLNIPFGLLALLGILRFIPETRDPVSDGGFDVWGAVLSAVAMSGLVFALIEGAHYGWWRQTSGALSPVPVALALALVAAVVFARHVTRRVRAGRSALVDPHLFGIPTLRYGVIAAGIVAFGEFGLMFVLPLLLEGTLGYSALGAGWMLVSLAAGAFLASGMTPQLTAALGQRTVVRIGLASEAFAVAGLAWFVSPTVAGWVLAVCLFIYGLGVGMATAQLSSLIMSDVPRAQGGQASGVQSTIRQVGSALGIALLGTLLVTSLGSGLDSRLADAGMPVSARVPLVELVRGSAGAGIPALDRMPDAAQVAPAAREAMVAASRTTMEFATAALLLGLLATLALPRPESPRPEQ